MLRTLFTLAVVDAAAASLLTEMRDAMEAKLMAGMPAEHRQLKASAAPWKAAADFHILEQFDSLPGDYATKLARCTGLGIKEACCKQEVNAGMAAKGCVESTTEKCLSPSSAAGACGLKQRTDIGTDNTCKLTMPAACTFTGSGAAGCVALPSGAEKCLPSGKTTCPTTAQTCESPDAPASCRRYFRLLLVVFLRHLCTLLCRHLQGRRVRLEDLQEPREGPPAVQDQHDHEDDHDHCRRQHDGGGGQEVVGLDDGDEEQDPLHPQQVRRRRLQKDVGGDDQGHEQEV